MQAKGKAILKLKGIKQLVILSPWFKRWQFIWQARVETGPRLGGNSNCEVLDIFQKYLVLFEVWVPDFKYGKNLGFMYVQNRLRRTVRGESAIYMSKKSLCFATNTFNVFEPCQVSDWQQSNCLLHRFPSGNRKIQNLTQLV